MGWIRGRARGIAVAPLLAALAGAPACSSDDSSPAPPIPAMCNGLPTDLQVDTQNCGACENVCEGISAVCIQGVCGCPAQAGTCADGCDDLSSDPLNCGACGNACGSGFACVNGSCGCANESMCAGQCTDLESDRNNCGSCGNACGPKQTCVSGACTGTCVTNGDCGGGEACSASIWLCADGTQSCTSNLDCSDPTIEYCGLGRCLVQGSRQFTFMAPDSGCAPGTETSNPSLTTCTDHFQTCSPTEPCPNAWLCLAMMPNAVDGTCVQVTDGAFAEAGAPPDANANDGAGANDGGAPVDASGVGAANDATMADAAVVGAMVVDATVVDSRVGAMDAAAPDATVLDAAALSDATMTADAADEPSTHPADDVSADDASADDASSAASSDATEDDAGP
jgi:hypothetical protein